ncbi:MAG TPA: rhomboid family intramembrane serine protease [Terriglobia bacterium]|nr:rhomboid family intramembrane serine protease [Terriglobia bacterium]
MVPIPINDNVRRSTFWLCTLLIILANVWVFLYELSLGREVNELVKLYGIVPARYINLQGNVVLKSGGLVSIFTSMFLHGGWLHLLGNMLFLFVFGRSVEDRFGHLKFLVIYFLGGFGGAVLHIFLNTGSPIPSIGASGAIAAILGAYFVSFPRARISTIIWVIFFLWRMELPAVLILGYWFLFQFVSGYTQWLSIQSGTAGGVAFWAHVGGFICGLLLALILGPRRATVEVVE